MLFINAAILGAHSWVRKQFGIEMEGEQSGQHDYFPE